MSLETKTVYRDWAMEPRDDDTTPSSQSAQKNSNFPVRLHCLIAEAEKDGQDHIIAWQPHGRCFAIHKPAAFVSTLLPLWFRQKKLESFQRQLNIYGFSRVASGPDKGCYFHELFLRGKDFLARRIPRGTAEKGSSYRGRAKLTCIAPNFYQMPYLPATGRTLVTRHDEATPPAMTTNTLEEWVLTNSMVHKQGSAFSATDKSNKSANTSSVVEPNLVNMVSPPTFSDLAAIERSGTRNRMTVLAAMNDLVLQMTNRELEKMVASASRHGFTTPPSRSAAHPPLPSNPTRIMIPHLPAAAQPYRRQQLSFQPLTAGLFTSTLLSMNGIRK